MATIRNLALLAGCLSLVTADYVPNTLISDQQGKLPGKRVAIIGAGSAGSSTAYYLRQFTNEVNPHVPINITVYDRNAYVGGRSTTVDAFDDPSQPIELGASIFVQVNRNLIEAVDRYNLSVGSLHNLQDESGESLEQKLGIWNGDEFVLTQVLPTSSTPKWLTWWRTTKLLFRYLWAPLTVVKLKDDMLSKFLKLYDAPVFPWTDGLQAAALEVGVFPLNVVSGWDYMSQELGSWGDRFLIEVVQASTRVNYAMNLGGIHALEALVCMATDGAVSVDGGNWQIFKGMLTESNAHLSLATDVVAVERCDKGFIVRSKPVTSPPNTKEETSEESTHPPMHMEESFYDTIILAAPFHQSKLLFEPQISKIPDDIEYINLHVTLFSSPHKLSGSFFGLGNDADVPSIVLTTTSDPLEEAPGKAGFYSISTLGVGLNPGFKPPRREFIYKIFSAKQTTDTYLHSLLGILDGGRDSQQEHITWIYRKLWQSYPREKPIERLDSAELDTDLWYTNGIEAFISTMETSSLSGMNVAKLIVDGWQLGEAQEQSTVDSNSTNIEENVGIAVGVEEL